MHALNIAFDRLGTSGHRTVNPGSNFHRAAAHDICAEIRRYLDSQTDLSIAHSPVQIIIIGYGSLFRKISRACNLLRVIAADRRIVTIKHGELQILDIQVNTVTNNEHQDNATQNSQRCADRITLQFQSLTSCVSQHSPQVWQPAWSLLWVCFAYLSHLI
ncbi:hypothetical protein D3C80_1659560 [compost metagenome]